MVMFSCKKVLVFGDSLARGVIYDDEHGRYRISPCAAVNSIAEKTGIEIVNRARMGMTAESGLAQMKADLEAGLSGDAVLLEFGGNDCDFDWCAISENPDAEHAPKTPLALYERDMRDMIRLARRKNMAVALCTLPPIISESYFDFFSAGRLNRDNILRWLGDTNKIYRYHERYSLLLSRLARDCACRLLDLRSAFLEKWDPHPYFCRDGIHPNNDGQMLIRDAVLAQIG